MSLDGLRAWIGEVERKLGMRTRVFLVLTVIAIGGAGAAIYLAVDARDNSVSESDVQALQERLEARIGEGGGGSVGADAQLEAELKALQAEVEQLRGEGGGSGQGQGNPGGGAGNGASGSSSEGTGGASSGGRSDSATDGDASSTRLKQLLEQAKEQNAQAVEEQDER